MAVIAGVMVFLLWCSGLTVMDAGARRLRQRRRRRRVLSATAVG